MRSRLVLFVLAAVLAVLLLPLHPGASGAEPAEGNIVVTIYNVNGEPAAEVPGVAYGVLVSPSNGNVVATAYMNASSQVAFLGVPPGTYQLYVYHYPNSGLNATEYWGSMQVTASSGVTSAYAFRRDTPWISSWRASYLGNGSYSITVDVNNSLGSPVQGLIFLVVSPYMQFAGATNLSVQATYEPGVNAYNFTFTPSAGGAYFVYPVAYSYIGNPRGTPVATDQDYWRQAFVAYVGSGTSWANMPAEFVGVPPSSSPLLLNVSYALTGGGYEYVIAGVSEFPSGSAYAGSYAFSYEDVGSSPVEVMEADVAGSGAVLFLVSTTGNLTAYVYDNGALVWSGTYYNYIVPFYVYIPGLRGSVAVYVESPSGATNVSGGLVEYLGGPPTVMPLYFFTDIPSNEGLETLPAGGPYYLFLTAYGDGHASVFINSSLVADIAFNVLAPYGSFPADGTHQGAAGLLGPVDSGPGLNVTVEASAPQGSAMYSAPMLLVFPQGNTVLASYNFSFLGVGSSPQVQDIGYAPPNSSALVLYFTSDGWGGVTLYEQGRQVNGLYRFGSGGEEGPGLEYYPNVSGQLALSASCDTGTTDMGGVVIIFRGRPPLYEPMPTLVAGSTAVMSALTPEGGAVYVAAMGFGSGAESFYANSSEFGAVEEPSGSASASLGTISFVEAGLPGGSLWGVELAGLTSNTTSGVITFTEAPGSYEFRVLPPPSFTASPLSGVVQTGQTVYVSFSPSSSSTSTTVTTVTATSTTTVTSTITTTSNYTTTATETTTTTTTTTVTPPPSTVTYTTTTTVRVTSPTTYTITSTAYRTPTATHTTTPTTATYSRVRISTAPIAAAIAIIVAGAAVAILYRLRRGRA
ncbi:hypothetical protein ASAC_1499 [Acidilobus saccharovorans 345-15]|uniref:Thermopsin n=1 Tax=Acidilobus saccharovorans (strain DSM 16705 / JCM 18335 / VKM B-2471 / 345-15) TaxID=666510 RepID=D9PZB7_ACIS3|nr:hypothetical protein [Acidilobus saccharovorans]ADL19904.1 hypothetical protein ASAC_1499 [Acidilobus saccharovorans 345-15]